MPAGSGMIRLQIQLAKEQHRRLQRWARRLGISLSEAVRRCVTDHLDRAGAVPSRQDRIRAGLAVCGSHADPEGSSRVARNHDRHLFEAYRR